MRVVDLRSDTVTIPPREMLETIPGTALGDDVYGEDPTVNELQCLAAEIMGKESALLVASGTMGHTVALLEQTRRGDEIILESECHIEHHELGNFASLGGLTPRLVYSRYGAPDPRDVEALIKPSMIYGGGTALVCLENTHNRAGGTVISPEQMAAVYDVAKRYDVRVHLDGARIFNAAVATGRDVKEFTRYADTMIFCLSKGLGAPIGSLVLGDKEFIDKARRVRRSLGGGMRKAGIIAAPGIYALHHMVERLREDHENARLLAEGIRDIHYIELDVTSVQTNMVTFKICGLDVTHGEFIKRLSVLGVKASEVGSKIRMVTHYGITREDIEYAVDAIHQALCKNN
ncbi:MAG: GntG family PLP-dependent aldolase [Candidatus Bathyarchaeia archaeon]